MIIKKRRFIQNALLMTTFTFFLRFIGTGFSIYVSNRIGAEGMGLYQLASSVYLLGVTIATSGITVAVTRIVSEQLALNNTRMAKAALRQCTIVSGILGIVAAVLLFFSAEYLSLNLLKDSRVILSLKLLAFGLPFLSVASVLRGYFLGASKPLKAISGDAVEQFTMMIITISTLSFFLPKGLEYACCGLVIGSSLSEAISCIYAGFIYKREQLKATGESKKGLTKQILLITLPIAASNYVRSALTSLENILIPRGLKAFGQTNGEALSQYGMIKGMAMPILFFPSAILSAFASLLIPEISSANALNAQRRIEFIISKCLKATLLFAFFITGMFLTFYKEIGLLFYKSEAIGGILLFLAPLVPLIYIDQIVDSILKGLNQQVSAMKYNTADAIIRTFLVWVLVPILGLKGYIIMLYAGTVFNASLSLGRLIVVGKVKLDIINTVVLPSISVLFSCIAVKMLFDCHVLAMIFIAVGFYLFFLFVFRCIKKRDILWVIKIFYSKKEDVNQ